MAKPDIIPDKVHLVGSIGLDTVEEVYRMVGKHLGRRVRRVPDGEPGGRRLWISWQYPLLRASPFLKIDAEAARGKSTLVPTLCLGDDVRPDDVRFSELGYAREARTSYQDFLAARGRGELPAVGVFRCVSRRRSPSPTRFARKRMWWRSRRPMRRR